MKKGKSKPDAEFIMEVLGKNMAWPLKKIHA
jgi:hypothetical protein